MGWIHRRHMQQGELSLTIHEAEEQYMERLRWRMKRLADQRDETEREYLDAIEELRPEMVCPAHERRAAALRAPGEG